jgi:hypothetical protein
VARSAGVYIMRPMGLEYNPLLNGEMKGVVKIKEMAYDSEGKVEMYSRETYGLLPFEHALCKFYIFSNELKLI